MTDCCQQLTVWVGRGCLNLIHTLINDLSLLRRPKHVAAFYLEPLALERSRLSVSENLALPRFRNGQPFGVGFTARAVS